MALDEEDEEQKQERDLAELLATLDAAASAANALLGQPAPSAALVPTGGAVPAVQMKQALAVRRSEIAKTRAAVEKASRALEAQMRNKIAEAEQALAPMMEMVKVLEEGIWTVNLYLGRDEDIVTLVEGEPAPDDTPITVRQMVLSMDQESMIAAETGGIDAQTMDGFDEWILDPAHLDQILPEPKGVVVLVPRQARDRDYRDPWLQAQMEEANSQSYWLIRNGSQLFRMSTNFKVGKHLVPTRDEFTSFFEHKQFDATTKEYVTVPIEPGTDAWEKADKKANARQRHFMRSALILQGLIDRTTVFHPLPGTVSLLHPTSYDAGHIQIITDAEVALGTGREPFYEWLSRLNEQLRPGMRVIGAFNSEEWRSISREDSDYGSRKQPRDARGLNDGEIYTIEGRERIGGLSYLVIKFKRTDMQWKRMWIETRPGWGYQGHREMPYEKRAKVRVHHGDRCILPFDLVTVEEMEAYLAARSERHAYVTMVPLLRQAIAAKKAEMELEAPFRLMLAGNIADATTTPDEVLARLPELVDWWKLANRWHRPLVADDETAQTKAVRMISEEYRRRMKAESAGEANEDAEAATVGRLRRSHPHAMMIARKRDGSYVTFEPQDEGRQFCRRHLTSATGRRSSFDEWIIPGTTWKKWRILWSGSPWDEWDHTATLSSHLTGPERQTIIDALLAEAPEGWIPLVIVEDTKDRQVDLWSYQPEDIPAITPTHLITESMIHGLTAKRTRREWSRGRGMALEIKESDGWGGNGELDFYDRGKPWRTDAGHVLVWEDTDALNRARQNQEEGRAVEKLVSRLADQAWDAVRSVGTQWEAQREAEVYSRFLEDYLDPDLWEGHRKTLRLPRFEYDRYGRRGGDPSKGLQHLANLLVEGGVQLDGMSVANAIVLCRKVAGVDIDVADDVLDLVFNPPNPEDDEEDDDDA